MSTTTTLPRRALRLAAAAALTLGTLGAAACSDDDDDGGSTTGATASGVTAPAQDAGGGVERFNEPTAPVEVQVGKKFEIALLTDPVEGYTWTLVDPGDSSIIVLQESQPNALPGDDESTATDGAGTDVFLFDAVGVGETSIELTKGADYPTTTTVDTTTITVIVTE